MFTITVKTKNPNYLTDEVLTKIIAICSTVADEVTITCEHENAAKLLEIISEVK
jgi:hypothetical protein